MNCFYSRIAVGMEFFCSADCFGRPAYGFHVLSVQRVAGMIRDLFIYLRRILIGCNSGRFLTGLFLFKSFAVGCCKGTDMSICALKSFRITTVFYGITDVLHTITGLFNALHTLFGIIYLKVNSVGTLMPAVVRE